MAITTYWSSNSTGKPGSGTLVAISLPVTVQADDIIVAAAFCADNSFSTSLFSANFTFGGWNAKSGSSGAVTSYAYLYRICDGSASDPTGPVQLSNGPSSDWVGILCVIRGADTSTAPDGGWPGTSANFTTTADPVATGLTLSYDNDQIIYFAACFSAVKNTPDMLPVAPSGYTQQVADTAYQSHGNNYGVAAQGCTADSLASSGSTGNITGTQNPTPNTDDTVAFILAFPPAGGSGDASIPEAGNSLAMSIATSMTAPVITNQIFASTSPSAIAAATSMTGPVAGTGTQTSPTVISAATAVSPTTTVTTTALPSPAAIQSVTTFTAPAVITTATGLPSAIAATTLLTQSTAWVGVLAAPGPLSAAATFTAPAITTTAQASPSALALVTTVPQPAASASTNADAQPTAISAASTLTAPAVSAGGLTQPSVLALATTVPAAGTVIDEVTAPAAVASATTLTAPAIVTSAAVSPSTIASSVSITAPAITTGGTPVTVTPAVISGLTIIYDVFPDGHISVTGAWVSLSSGVRGNWSNLSSAEGSGTGDYAIGQGV